EQAALTGAGPAQHPDCASDVPSAQGLGAEFGVRRGHARMTSRGSDKYAPTGHAPAGLAASASVTDLLCTYRFGPPGPARVLAIHGLTGHGKRWETLFTRHLPDVTALAPDLLGHGRSSWDAPWTIDANVAALAALV